MDVFRHLQRLANPVYPLSKTTPRPLNTRLILVNNGKGQVSSKECHGMPRVQLQGLVKSFSCRIESS